MSEVSNREIVAIKEWLMKEPHLPKNFDDMHLRKFIYSCHNSLERTKQCIDEFCTRRAIMSESYTNRDPKSKRIQRAFEIMAATYYMDGDTEIWVYRLKDMSNDFDFYDCLKILTLIIDVWILLPPPAVRLPENHILVYDMSFQTLKLEALPVRLKEVHLINCPPFYETLYNLVKPVFPEYLCKVMHFHKDHTGLYDFMNKKILPKDYGGEADFMKEQDTYRRNEVLKFRKIFTDDTYWKADLTYKQKSDTTMQGSFKTLEID